MKVITEALVRLEIKDTNPSVYYIPEGKLLSPAAREYLNQQKIAIDYEKNRKVEAPKEEVEQVAEKKEVACAPKAKYTDYETGAGYVEKPEHMTQLFGNMLVDKNHPRIAYRGKIDSLQAEIVFAQATIMSTEGNKKVVEDLDNILGILREMMRCEVLDEPFTNDTIIGMSHAELREKSHAPMKFFKVEYMKLPDYTMGITYSLLNKIRASIRETEVVAVNAFRENRRMVRKDIIEELNRLSSALHIMMCMYLAGQYNDK